MPRRLVVDLSRGWEFARGRVRRAWLAGGPGRGNDHELVDLPHCWNDREQLQRGLRYYQGYGAYRRRLQRDELPEPPPGATWHLVSDGFYGRGTLFVDGRRVARVIGQYLGFAHDIGRQRQSRDDSVVALRLCNHYHASLLPGFRDPDFLLYGGLAGRMRLTAAPELAIEESATTVRTTDVLGASARVVVATRILNRSPRQRKLQLRWSVTDGAGDGVAGAEAVDLEAAPGCASRVAESVLEVAAPRLWSPESPDLYWAVVTLLEDGEEIDELQVRFGFRQCEFRPDEGFFLNGERLALAGCNRHQCLPGFGNALPDELQRSDAEQLKAMGCNFVRLSHYPQQPAFLDACDELGLLVMPEIASWKSVRRGRWLRAASAQMDLMVKRDRHRPSVIVWGMGNESRSRRAYLRLGAIVRELDPERPTTYAENHLYRARREQTTGLVDVWGTNYELGLLAEGRDSSRLRTVIATECGNFPRAHRGDPSAELRQLAEIERTWEALADKPYVAGYAIWCFADYATMHRRRFSRHPGLVDAWRVPKMAAALFAARHASQPILEVFPLPPGAESRHPPRTRYRTDADPRGRGLACATAHVISSCERVRVFADGVEIGRLSGALHYVLPIDPDWQELRAFGDQAGATISARIARHGPARRILLACEGRGVQFPTAATVAFTVQVADDKGTPVRDWNGHVRLATRGPCHLRAYTATDETLVAAGHGRCYVAGTGTPGLVTVEAHADGLEPGELSLTFGP